MTEPRTYLPPSLMEIAEIAGMQTALRIGATHAGRKLYVPQQVGPRHPLVQLVGMDAARCLVARYGGDTLTIPAALSGEARRRRETIHRLTEASASQTEIANAIGIDRRTVQRNQAKARGGRRGGNQGDLFD